MSRNGDIIRRFLKQNKPNEYHMINSEVYNAMNELSKVDINNDVIADSLRALKGHLDNISIYMEKGYNEGINTCLTRSNEIIDKMLNYIKEGTNNA